MQAAASGTVTLELALAGVPMVVGYKMDLIAWQLRFLVKVQSIVLANLVLGENVFPEFLQPDCTGENLAAALQVDVTGVSVKGKTNEGVDAVGRGEAIAAHAVALLSES